MSRQIERRGRAVALGELLWAPLTARRCLAYCAIVEEPGLLRRTLIAREHMSSAFALEDGTRIEDATRVLAPAHVFFVSDHLRDPGELLRLFLARHGRKHVDFLGLNRCFRYREGVVVPGDWVQVHGAAEWQPATAGSFTGSYREAPRRVVLRRCTVALAGEPCLAAPAGLEAAYGRHTPD